MDTLETFMIASPSAGEPRTAWVQRLTTGPADNCLIFLDAEGAISSLRVIVGDFGCGGEVGELELEKERLSARTCEIAVPHSSQKGRS